MNDKGKIRSNSAKRRRTKPSHRMSTRAQREHQDTRLKTLNQLVQVLSHETRNILGSFATCLELLRRSTQLNQDDRELVGILQSGSRRLNEISEQFAAFGPRPPLRLETIELSALIGNVIERLRRDERCSSTLEFRVASDAVVRNVVADRHFLEKCLWNLFLNAVQAMGANGTLEIKTQQSKGAIEIHVRDTGPGIPASLRAKIFEPLFTTKPRATGLGLAIARRIAEEHGGELRLHTSQKTGGQFIVALPRPAARDKNKIPRIRSSAHKDSRAARQAAKPKG